MIASPSESQGQLDDPNNAQVVLALEQHKGGGGSESRYSCIQSTAGCKRLQEARPLGEINLLTLEPFISIYMGYVFKET